jgi:hypothetical protein
MQGGATWIVLTMTQESLDCWHASHAGGARSMKAQCVWSLSLGASLGRFEPRAADTGVLRALRFTVQRDAICALVAVRRLRARGEAAAFTLALAFFKCPAVGAAGVWGTSILPLLFSVSSFSVLSTCLAFISTIL